MPIDYKKYPKNWKELRASVLNRANNKCEFCGVENYSFVNRENGPVKIVLTIAHLDHDEQNHNVKLERLAALCQKCHLTYDIPEKKKRRRNKKAVEDLFPQGSEYAGIFIDEATECEQKHIDFLSLKGIKNERS
jgi:hypothetical protein